MTIAQKLTAVALGIENIRAAIVAKGGVLPPGSALSEFPAAIPSSGWTRPAEWPVIPELTTQHAMVFELHKPAPNTMNTVAAFTYRPNIASGNIIIDWGDGMVDTIAVTSTAIATATHRYFWETTSGAQTAEGAKFPLVTVNATNSSNRLPVLQFNSQATHQGWVDIWVAPMASATNFGFGSISVVGSKLQRVRLSNALPGAASITSWFNNCESLEVVDFGGSNKTSLSNTFVNCHKLHTVLGLTTNGCTNFSNAFNGCHSLKDLSWANFDSTTSAAGAFTDCKSLGALEVSAPATASWESAFEGCGRLRKLKLSINSENTTKLLLRCAQLEELDYTNSGTNGSLAAFTAPPTLRKLLLNGYRTPQLPLANTNLSTDALNTLFTSLGSAASNLVIDITGTPGAATCNRSIVTAKSWQVMG